MTNVGDALLARMNTTTLGNPMYGDVDEAHGSVFPGEAQLLYGFVRALLPGLVLEVGTSAGYSTLHLAAGCQDNGRGRVYTVEIHEGRQALAKKHIEEAGLSAFVSFCNSIPDNAGVFDLVFLDAGHTAEDVREYLGAIDHCTTDGCIALAHDSRYGDHVALAVRETRWAMVELPTRLGMAILQR